MHKNMHILSVFRFVEYSQSVDIVDSALIASVSCV